VRIGISVCSHYQIDDPRQGARYMVERAAAARAADLDSLFVGDHHATATTYYQNNAILGRMLAEWGNKPAGALYLLPLWNPVLLAEQIGTLAALMPGRFVMQCGIGGDAAQFAAMGCSIKQRVPMFEAALAIMQALWRGETVTHERFWNIQQARINPVPAEPVEVWIGSTALPAIERTARLADGWLASPGLTMSQAREQLNPYRQSCAEHARTPRAVAIRRDIYVGSSSQQAAKVKSHYLAKGYRGLSEDALMTGSVAEVADAMAEFEAAGFTDIVVRNMHTDQGEALATIERLAQVKAQLRV